MLSAGAKLGPYEILSPLGAGGMGEVYKARDTRLDRTVAIKILPPTLSSNPELKQRFDREARALSSFQHPHICTLYDVGSQDGADFLVMEHLEGESLSQRLEKGPVPPDQLLRIAINIADALDKAHRQGVIHRDIKPGNIMLTKAGAKLLDFGLARGAAAGAMSAAVSQMMTQNSPLTTQGTIIGTFQYMAPEQLEGREADARSDIFSFGAVLYEMATGRRAFDGKTQASVIAAVLASEPQPLTALAPTAPPALDHVIKTCLAKDPEERFHSAHDLLIQLKFIAHESLTTTQAIAAPVPRRRVKPVYAWALAAVFFVAAALLAAGWWREARRETSVIRAVILAPDKNSFDITGDFAGPAVISPDGKRIAFVARSTEGKSIWVRPLDSLAAQRLDGTDAASFPFWSADSRNLGFFADGRLKKIPAGGGPVTIVADAQNARGGAWGPDNTIVFASNFQGGLSRVSAGGGAVSPATTLDGAKHTTHRWPNFLPDGKHFLYLATNHSGGTPELNGVYLGSLDGGTDRLIIPSDAGAQYASGYLLFHAQTALMAQPFDPSSATLSGEAAPVVNPVQHDSGVWRTVSSASDNGTLIYHAGSAALGSDLVWYDRRGTKVGTVGGRDKYRDPAISPDGRRLAVALGDPQWAIWIVDLERATRTRLTFDTAINIEPSWSPDGRFVVFTSGTPSLPSSIRIKAVSGAGEDRSIVEEGGNIGFSGPVWSPDGKYIVYGRHHGPAGNSLYAAPLDGGKPFVVVPAPSPSAVLTYPRVSPDGRWLAYTSSESGRPEIYVTAFPSGRGKWQVSNSGGDMANWRRDGKEIYYYTVSSEITRAAVHAVGDEFSIGETQVLFPLQNTIATGRLYDAAPDGSRFLSSVVQQDNTSPITLVTNWTAEMRK